VKIFKSTPEKDEKNAPKIISDISAHLASPPIARVAGWVSSTKPREADDKDWIQKSYPSIKKDEEADYFLKQLRLSQTPVDARPPMASIQSILKTEIPSESKKGKASYTILVRSDALINHNFPVFKDCIMVMASQGNCQESMSRKIMRLRKYAFDKTQGPASARSTVDATLARRAFIKNCDMMLAWLEKYDKEKKLFDYQNGYLTPKEGQVKVCLTLLETHGQKILMNIQQVRIDNADEDDKQWMTQVPCFAFALGKYELYKSRSVDDQKNMRQLCQKLLELQYQAVAKLAVLKSIKLNRRIPLVLTPVGAGVFGNDAEAVTKAIESIRLIVQDWNVDVVLSVYESSHVGYFERNISFLNKALTMSHEQMGALKSQELGTHIPKSSVPEQPLSPISSNPVILMPLGPPDYKLYLKDKRVVIEFLDEKCCEKLEKELVDFKAPELKISGNIVEYTPVSTDKTGQPRLVKREGQRLIFCTYKNKNGEHVIPLPNKAVRDLITTTLEVTLLKIFRREDKNKIPIQERNCYLTEKGVMSTYDLIPDQERNIYFSPDFAKASYAIYSPEKPQEASEVLQTGDTTLLIMK
jgi:hypothetical protein